MHTVQFSIRLPALEIIQRARSDAHNSITQRSEGEQSAPTLATECACERLAGIGQRVCVGLHSIFALGDGETLHAKSIVSGLIGQREGVGCLRYFFGTDGSRQHGGPGRSTAVQAVADGVADGRGGFAL